MYFFYFIMKLFKKITCPGKIWFLSYGPKTSQPIKAFFKSQYLTNELRY